MTRKDYVAIAAIIAETSAADALDRAPEHRGFPLGVESARAVIAHRLAGHLQADNPRFDRARFLEACKIGQ